MAEWDDPSRKWPTVYSDERRGGRTEEYFLAEAERIAAAFPSRVRRRVSGEAIGKRRVLRDAVAPRFRPLSVFKRDTYALGCKVHDLNGHRVLERYVRARDAKWFVAHRPRQPTVIDWTLRLVRGRLLGPVPTGGLREPSFLFDSITLSRMTIELNFAFRHWIAPEYVTMFIDEMGGHEIIAARLVVGEYDFRDEDWIGRLQRDRWSPFTNPRPETQRRALSPSNAAELDDDDENEEGNPLTPQRKPSRVRPSGQPTRSGTIDFQPKKGAIFTPDFVERNAVSSRKPRRRATEDWGDDD